VIKNFPRIEEMVALWKATEEDADVFKSELEKNPELKALMLSQTPWVLDAETEAEQRRRITLFFDVNYLAQEERGTWNKIKSRQNGDGGFMWMPGGRSSGYVTREVLEIFGLLKQVDGLNPVLIGKMNGVLMNAMQYVDREIERIYNRRMNKHDVLPTTAVHYLYLRTLHPEIAEQSQLGKKILDYYLDLSKSKWNERGLYEQGLIASIFMAREDVVYKDILQSIKERSVIHEEIGRYWKNNAGYYWYQRPLITHAHMIRLYEEEGDKEFVSELKLWLLKHKQTNAWESSRATTAAVHALISSGDAWINASKPMSVQYGNTTYTTDDGISGLGYLKESIDLSKNIPSEIKTTSASSDPSWAALHWQYWTDLDKAEVFEETPLKLSRQIAIVKNTDTQGRSRDGFLTPTGSTSGEPGAQASDERLSLSGWTGVLSEY